MPQASPAPSRVLRPRPTTQPSRQNTQTFTTNLSPVVSDPMGGYTPQPTSYASNSTGLPSRAEDPSMVAVHGSAPCSPVLKARREESDSAMFVLPPRQGWSDPPTQTDSASMETDHPERTPNSGRVIAIDADVFRPEPVTEEATSEERMQIMPGSPAMTPETQMRGLIKGLTLVFKSLRDFGHPLHLVSSGSPAEKQNILDHLNGHGITVGMGEDGLFAALWCVGWSATTAEDGLGAAHSTSAGGTTALRAINAGLYITIADLIPEAILGASTLHVIQVSNERPPKDTETQAGAASPYTPQTSGDRVVQMDKWADVEAWVTSWDRE